MTRFARFNPAPDEFVTLEQQEATLRAANERTRQPRPNQKPPVNKATGRKRKQTQDGHQATAAAASGGSKHTGSKQWRKRMQQRSEAWANKRESNKQHALQYRAFHAEGIHLDQLAAADLCAAMAVAKAVVSHPCFDLSMEPDKAAAAAEQLQQQMPGLSQQQQSSTMQQQQPQQAQQQQHQEHASSEGGSEPQQQPSEGGSEPQQQQQQQQQEEGGLEQQPLFHIVSTRLVACHTLGVSFWLPVPSVKCRCCNEEWEVQPASAGFFGSTPVQPYAWFSQQLLDFHTQLSTAGTSFTSLAAASDRANVRQKDAGLKVKTW
jgi:hypothetical protein